MKGAAGFDAVVRLLEDAIAQGLCAGAAVCLRDARGPRFSWSGGMAELRPRPRPVRPGQAWDLASLTKILATTPLCLALVGQRGLDLDRPLRAWLPWAPEGVTARHCLQHGSGLPAWLPLYERVDEAGLPWGAEATRAFVAHQAAAAAPQARPGEAHVYSDLGMILLGAALEAWGEDRLDRLWERFVRAPLGVDLRWGWPGAAATEDCPRRGRVLSGEVHDLNAAVMGGIAPHAGLFGSAEEVAAAGSGLLSMARGERAGIPAALLNRAFREAGPGSHRLGFDGRSPVGSSAGQRWPRDGVGHLGFTGTSLWLSPSRGLSAALLCNRVHPEVEGGAFPGRPPGPRTLAFRALRPAVHDALLAALDG